MTMLEVGLGAGVMLVLNLLRPSVRGRRTAPASGTNVGGVSPGRVKAWHKVVFEVVPRYGKGRPVLGLGGSELHLDLENTGRPILAQRGPRYTVGQGQGSLSELCSADLTTSVQWFVL